MPDTAVRDIELIEVGSLGKETLSNDAFLNLSYGISGAALIALAATDHTLTLGASGEAMRFVLILTGTLTANVNVIVPAESRVYVVDNRTTGVFTVTFRPASGGGVAVDQSARTLIYCDGVNVYPVASGTGGGGGSGAPTDASYLVGASHTLLSGERVVTNTPTISWDLSTVGQAKAIIPPDAVTYSHIQNVTAGRLLGRDTASAGDVQEITLGTGLSMSAGGVLSATGGGGGQPLDATLTALAGLATGANQLPYSTGTDTFSQTPLSAFARTLLDDADAATMRGTLSAQASDATLTALAGVTTGADTLPFFTGTDTASTTTLTAFMRGLLDDPDLATAQATLGITGGGGGSTTLLGLTDVPDTYTGQATKVLAVRADETGTEFVTPAAGGGAPTDAEYITSTANASLSAERVLTDTATITWDRTTAGQIKATAVGGPTYTDEQAQDAVGAMLLDTATIDLTYTDATPSLSAVVNDSSITEAKLGLSDVTTRDASTSAHGLLRKLSGTPTQYLDGSGAWTTPAGGTNYWSRAANVSPLQSAFTAFWSLEESTGNRVDRVGSLAMVPVGGANLTQVAGRIGNAVGMNGTVGTYLTLASTPAVQMSTTTSLTLVCWVYLPSLISTGYLSKGNAGASASYEYLLQLNSSNKFRFGIANGTTFQLLDDTGPAPTINTWHLVIGWYDQAAGTVNLQVNNGTVISAAATTTSYASAHPCEIGRLAGYSGSASLNGRIDMPGIAKRVFTASERTQLWNGGAGLDWPFEAVGGDYLAPLTATDNLLLGAIRTSTERLEVDGAIKVGTTTGTMEGTLRWSGTDMQARKGGAWVSMTGAGASVYTDEQAQDAVGAMLVDTATIDLTYTDATPSLTAAVVAGSIGTTQLGNDQVTYAKIQNVTATDRLLGRVSAGAGDVEELVCTAAGRALLDDADAAVQRTTLGLGTMAQQDAANVAIMGGSATGLTILGVGGTPPANAKVLIAYQQASANGLRILPTDNDTGGAYAVALYNVAGANVGGIATTATATAYNTSSDVRLKHAITALTGALAVVQALRPVRFVWNADGSEGHGFLAHELQREIPDAVSGEPDAINEDGSVKPQQVDHSRLVPWLTAALQDTLAQVQALTARVAALEGAMP